MKFHLYGAGAFSKIQCRRPYQESQGGVCHGAYGLGEIVLVFSQQWPGNRWNGEFRKCRRRYYRMGGLVDSCFADIICLQGAGGNLEVIGYIHRMHSGDGGGVSFEGFQQLVF